MFARFTGGFVSPSVCSLALVCFSATALTAAPQLRLSTAAVGPLYMEVGGSVPAQTINAFNIGDGSLHLSIASSAPWLNASLGLPTTCQGGPVTACIPIQMSVYPASLGIGTYTESLIISDPKAIDTPQTVTVTVQVNGAPSNVDLYVTPAGGPLPSASVTVNTGGTVQASAKTSDGGNWLSFTTAGAGSYNFFTPNKLTATAQPGQSGNYTGTVVLSGSSFAQDNRTINVNLHVTSQPILQVAPIVIQGLPGTINFQNTGLGSLAITGASVNLSLPGAGSNEWFTDVRVASATSVTVSVLNSGAPGYTPMLQGSYAGILTLNSNAANNPTAFPLRLNFPVTSGPTVFFGGVVDNASFAGGQSIGSGTIAAAFGSQLSRGVAAYASKLPLPTTLANVQILVNGTPAPLFYVDPNQIDFQVPFGLAAGTMLLQPVVNGQPGNIISAPVDSIAPRLFTLRNLAAAPDGLPYGIIINSSDGTLAVPSNLGVPSHPAHRGDFITIYALGLGPVSPASATGDAAPSSEPLARISNPIQVYFGGGFITPTSVTPSYAGLAPAFVGLYQINVTIPPDAPVGNIPITLNMPNHASNSVEMAIDPSPTM
jgi:uncharacterized protein (TIGR03437 family)